jgi:radical SAM superfamily enzyme YgiQ (UPF0313 family)
MELTYRKGADAFVPAGAYRRLEARLRERAGDLADVPAVVLYAFDRRTRMLPFILYDKRIFPAGPRAVAGALHTAGFRRVRAVFQLWNPNFRPSQARIDGRPVQLLLVSTMQIHAPAAYQAVADAWALGEDRPLIIVGGAKAVHEPYHFWPLATPGGPGGADVVVTGEVYILLDLLNVLADYHRPGEHIRRAFERARRAGALDAVPGLVYLDPAADWREPGLVETGLPRLVQHLDELPDEVVGLSLLEPPHRRTGLAAAPLPDRRVRRHVQVCSLQITQGCKFHCPYCPIPTLNQKTWRFRSPEGLVRQLRAVRERYGIKYFFGADDNFMNRRSTAEEYFEALARATVRASGRPKRLGHQVRWGTEATQHDTWKNRDLLPLASRAGLFAVWFGIEDLTAELVNKGQKPEVTTALFELMHRHKICPMAMMMFHDGQPFRSPGSLAGLAEQVSFLRRAGAVSVQVMVHVPAVGTREYEGLYAAGKVLRRLGEYTVPESFIDGVHVIVAGRRPGWRRQIEQLAAYFAFYNPINLMRALRHDGSPLRWYRVAYQVAGFVAACLTALKALPYTWRLLTARPTFHTAPPPLTRVPVRESQGVFSRYPRGALPAPAAAPAGRPARAAA